MFIKFLCIVALLEFSLSEYDVVTLPMSKDSKYGDDVCMYMDDNQKFVKPCQKGKYCDGSTTLNTLDFSRGKYSLTGNLEICQDLPNISSLYTYNDGCVNDYECENGYKCIEGVCSIECDSGKFYSGYTRNCQDNSLRGGFCFEESKKKNEIKYSPPEPNKECGKITFDDDPNDGKKGIYYINKREYVYNGEVEDGEYVEDNALLCKSGFALFFYKDGKTKDPRDSTADTINRKYLRCVTPISVSRSRDGECFINYKIGENGETLRYNVNKLGSSYDLTHYCSEPYYKYIKLKFEKYREFYTKITEEERKSCGDLDNSNKYTCENNELIKLWYFYKKPEVYNIYNDRKKFGNVIDYLIQKEYPCYSLSQFLSIKFIYLLFLLLF